ncbi:MAG: hypothetical protein ABI539_01490, partial [Acidobacteriota bacterium]
NDKVLVADSSNKLIRVIEQDGNTWTLPGGGGEGRDGSLGEAGMTEPTALAVDTHQNIYVADGDRIRVIGRRSLPFVETLNSARQGYIDGQRRRAQFNRPSGIALTGNGSVIVADSDDLVVRQISDVVRGTKVDEAAIEKLHFSAEEFRLLQPARWPFDPPQNKREIAGTLAEIRGEIGPNDKPSWFHNGLDIAGGYGEVARFVRDETVLDPHAVQNVGTTRELIRMPTMAYIHIRLGRDQNDRFLQETPFQAEIDSASGKILQLRVPRGTRFQAGDPIGTLNSLNHVHLIAGQSGAEMNALAALILPGVSDSIAPVIESTAIVDPNWNEIETRGTGGRIKLTEKSRVVVRAYDRIDGSAERRRLGVYKLGFRIFRDAAQAPDIHWGIIFDRMPPADAIPFVYAPGSQSGYSGTTVFNYIVTNDVGGGHYSEGFIDPAALNAGVYTLEVFAADIFGNTTSKTTQFEVSK